MVTTDMVRQLFILDEVTIFDKGDNYVIPRYQRAYAWEDKEIEQLIDDIYDIDDSDNYYIGSLVVSRVSGKSETFEVVDGQQRLTTLFLLLQYLVSVKALEGEVGQSLTFDCRDNSQFTLSHIKDILSENGSDFVSKSSDRIELSILNGVKAIRQKFASINVDNFVSKLQHVVLYRIEVPENTDLNRYFEIMNTRGEQLEQHDIVKAKLMSFLTKRNEQELFAKIWDACSDMTGYVQMHFSKTYREFFFGGGWNCQPNDEWDKYLNYDSESEEECASLTLKHIIAKGFKAAENGESSDDDARVRFDSIIDFPYFLLHALRVFIRLNSEQWDVTLGDLLDDKKLIYDFDKVIASGKASEEEFSQKFIMHLLQARYLFDCYIIKREYTGEDQNGEWSLKELNVSKQKPYYVNTKLNDPREWETTYAPRTKECLMIQSALRVSYTSPKVMHWITELLEWTFGEGSNSEYVQVVESIAVKAVKNNFLDAEDFMLGVETHHVVFNFLDYLLWKGNKEKYSDFMFEFRNSVEHWYPQNPSEGSISQWDDKDTFGNLCIVPRSVNSKFSNLSPRSKRETFEKVVKEGSLKLRIMGEIIEKCTNEEWKASKCKEHEDEMINILRQACGVYD